MKHLEELTEIRDTGPWLSKEDAALTPPACRVCWPARAPLVPLGEVSSCPNLVAMKEAQQAPGAGEEGGCD